MIAVARNGQYSVSPAAIWPSAASGSLSLRPRKVPDQVVPLIASRSSAGSSVKGPVRVP